MSHNTTIKLTSSSYMRGDNHHTISKLELALLLLAVVYIGAHLIAGVTQ